MWTLLAEESKTRHETQLVQQQQSQPKESEGDNS
jgi:hypothetical protein